MLEQLRAEVADPQFIPRLIREQLLNNQHRLTLTLRPDFELAKRKSDAERAKLDTIRGALSAHEEEQILSKSKALQARQSAEDDATLLPKVGIEDVPASLSEPHSKELTLSSGELLNFYAQGTNGLAYQQVVFDLPALPTELIEILPLYTSCITELGVGTRNYAQTQAWQAQVCGGLNCFSTIKGQVGDIQTLQGTVSFSSKCLVNNHRQVSELIYETLTEVRFDETQRIAELVDQITTRKLSSITGSGHALAMSAASSGFSPSAKMHHQYGGLEGLVRLKALRDKLEDTAQRSKLLEKFRELHAILLSAPRQFLLVAEPEKEEELTAEIDSFWDKKAQTLEVTPFSLPSIREAVKQAWVTSTQVNFCAYAYPTVGSDHPDHATLQVLAGYLRNGFLHSAIREVGGAYGGGASQDPASASFRFFSYRDPRLGETLADFKASITWLLGDAQQESQLEEAVLGVIASMDKPSSPAGEAKTAFYNRLFGRTLEQRTEFRKRVLATTLGDLKHVATRYFVDQEPSLAVITSAAKAEELEIEGLEINKI